MASHELREKDSEHATEVFRDDELVAAVRARNKDAFGRLFDLYGRRVYAYCLRRTADQSTAEDLMSATFLEAWRRAPDFRVVDGSALPWLFGIATNLLRNERRSLRRYGAALSRYVQEARVQSAYGEKDAADERERLAELLTQLKRLPAPELEAVVLCLWEGLSGRAASEALNVPETTIRTRLARARTRLRASRGSDGASANRSSLDGH
jgi:RNA polymerase sigma-70 factor (ECF subfamily)